MARNREVFIQMTADEQKAVESFLRVDRTMRGTEQTFGRATGKGKGFDTTLGGMRRTVSGLLPMLGLGGGLTGLLGGLAQGLGAVAEKNAAFTNDMRELLSLGDNLDKIGQMKQEVLDLSTQWGKSTQDIASGMFQVQSGAANMSTAMQENLLRTGAAMTEVYGGDLGDNIANIIKLMQIFPNSIRTASEAQSKAATIAEEGFLNLQQLSQFLPDVTGAVASLGYNINDIGAALIVATRLGGRTEKTFTGVRNVFQNMSTAIEEGLTTRQSFIEQLKDLAKVDPDTLKKIFGKDAAAAVNNLTQNVGQVSEAIKSMEANSNSAFDKMQKRAQDAGTAVALTLRRIQTASENLNKSPEGGAQASLGALADWEQRKLGVKQGLSNRFGGFGAVLAEAPLLGGAIQRIGALESYGMDSVIDRFGLTTRGVGGGAGAQKLLTTGEIGAIQSANFDQNIGVNTSRAERSAQAYVGAQNVNINQLNVMPGADQTRLHQIAASAHPGG